MPLALVVVLDVGVDDVAHVVVAELRDVLDRALALLVAVVVGNGDLVVVASTSSGSIAAALATTAAAATGTFAGVRERRGLLLAAGSNTVSQAGQTIGVRFMS